MEAKKSSKPLGTEAEMPVEHVRVTVFRNALAFVERPIYRTSRPWTRRSVTSAPPRRSLPALG